MPQVLIVEQDPTLLDVAAFRLELAGYRLVKAESAEQALDWLKDHWPALIIVDQFLPGIDGFEFLNRLSDVRASEIPVIFVSVNSDLDDVQRAYNAGANEYLVTPYDPVVLEDKVERLIHATHAHETSIRIHTPRTKPRTRVI